MLYGVSVGPGDPELMTLKAARILKSCAAIAVPRSGEGKTLVALEIAKKAVPEIAEKRIVEISMPMTRDADTLKRARETAVQTLIELSRDADAAFITLGDASVYSTYMYLHEQVAAAGIPAEIVPGVPSFCAAAALRSGKLTDADKPLHIVPGSYDCMEESLSWPGPKVIMKTGKQLGRVKELLRERGLLDGAFLVQNCGLEDQRACPLSELDDAGYFSIIFVEGRA